MVKFKSKGREALTGQDKLHYIINQDGLQTAQEKKLTVLMQDVKANNSVYCEFYLRTKLRV